MKLLFLCVGIILIQGCGSSPDNSYNTALQYLENQQPHLAEEQLLLTTKESPKNAEAWNQLGIISFERGDWQEAKERFEKAAKFHPFNPVYPRNVALVFAELKEYETALQLLNKAVEIKPNDAENYVAIAKVELLNQQNENAEQAIRKAIFLDPSNQEAMELAALIIQN